MINLFHKSINKTAFSMKNKWEIISFKNVILIFLYEESFSIFRERLFIILILIIHKLQNLRITSYLYFCLLISVIKPLKLFVPHMNYAYYN